MRVLQMRRVLILCVLGLLCAYANCWAEGADPAQKPVTIELKDVTTTEALEALFRGRGLSFSIAADVGGWIASMSFKDVPFETALKNVLRTAGLVWTINGGVYVISRKPGPLDTVGLQRRVDVEFKDTPLPDVLATLLKDSGISYTIDPSISQLKVTAVLRNLVVGQALREIGKASGIQYQGDGGVVKFTAARGLAYSTPRPPGYPPAPTRPTAENPFITDCIPLMYTDPGYVAPFLTHEGIDSVAALRDRKIMIRGTEDAIEQAKKTARMLDVPLSALRITVSAKAVAHETLWVYRAVLALIDGQEGVFNIAATPSGLQQAANKAELTLTPRVAGDGTVTIVGHGNFSFTVDDGKGHSAVISSPNINFATAIKPGKLPHLQTPGAGLVDDSPGPENVSGHRAGGPSTGWEKQIAAVQMTGPDNKEITLELTAKVVIEDSAMQVSGTGSDELGSRPTLATPGPATAQPMYRSVNP